MTSDSNHPSTVDTDPQSVEALLASMVSIPSVNTRVSGDPKAEAALGDYLERIANHFGLDTRRLPVADRADNLLILHRNASATADDARWLLFDSHMDTVSTAGMTIDPFGSEIRDGRLFGRGACDTKGTGAAMLWALREYAALPQQPNHIALLFSIDEEETMTGVRSFLANDLPRLRAEGIDPVGAIVGEPTLHRAVVGHNGLIRWKIATIGKAGHAAAPYLGRSAISMMAKVITAIESQYIAGLDVAHPLTGQAVCSINLIEGGTQINIIPERCEIALDRRLVPGEDAFAVLPAVAEVLNELQGGDSKLLYEQFDEHTAPPMDPTVNEFFLPFVERVLHQCGFRDDPIGAPFCTHGGDLTTAGLPAIVLGPGDPTPAHTKDEWVALDEVRKGVEVYRTLMATEAAI